MLVADVETTGTDYRKHSMVSVGIIGLQEHIGSHFEVVGEMFYGECRMWEGAEATEKALEINGFILEQITDPLKISLEELSRMIFNYANRLKTVYGLKDLTVAGENPRFDIDFLNDSLKRAGIDYSFGYRGDDLHTTARNHHRSSNLEPPLKDGKSDLNGDKIFKYVGLSEEPKPHNALTGAKFEAESFSRLIYGKTLLEEFEIYPIPAYLLKQ